MTTRHKDILTDEVYTH